MPGDGPKSSFGKLFNRMAECNSPSELSDIAVKHTGVIMGTVAKALAANSAWINVLKGGTFKSGDGDVQKSAVQLPAAPGDSFAAPTFVADREICGTNGIQEKTEQKLYDVCMESKRIKGPRVCMKKTIGAFKSSLLAAEDALKKNIVQYNNADIRFQLTLRSATKVVANSAYDFASLLTGGSQSDLGVQFVSLTPDAPLSLKFLQKVSRHLKDALWGSMFVGKGMEPNYRFIGGSDILDVLREQAVVQGAQYLTNGSFKLGAEIVEGFNFDSAPGYRGIAFGVDQRPLRYNTVGMDGEPVYINPVVNVTNSETNTAYPVANPVWLAARYEIGHLVADESFQRLTPERYTGEGTFKFAPQLVLGELEWSYIKDNDCNQWGDFGQHLAQISRAYSPIHPEHVIPIAFLRVESDNGLVAPEDESSVSSFSGADTFSDVDCDIDEEIG